MGTHSSIQEKTMGMQECDEQSSSILKLDTENDGLVNHHSNTNKFYSSFNFDKKEQKKIKLNKNKKQVPKSTKLTHSRHDETMVYNRKKQKQHVAVYDPISQSQQSLLRNAGKHTIHAFKLLAINLQPKVMIKARKRVALILRSMCWTMKLKRVIFEFTLLSNFSIKKKLYLTS